MSPRDKASCHVYFKIQRSYRKEKIFIKGRYNTCHGKKNMWCKKYFQVEYIFQVCGVFLHFFGVQLIYNVTLVLVYSKVTWFYTHTHICSFFFRFFSHIGYHRILSRVPYAIWQILVGYLSYTQQCCVCVNPKILIYPSPSHLAN